MAAASLSGTAAPQATTRWLADVGDTIRERLAAVGLAEARTTATIKGFAEAYIASRPDWAYTTRQQAELSVANAIGFWGPDKRLDAVTAADADALRAWVAVRVAAATMRKRMQFMKQLFKAAQRARLVTENPFIDQKTSNRANPERLRYIDGETVSRVADELVGERRLILLLARWAGLRIPSEANSLKWSDIDFGNERIRVFAQKTQRSRIVPMLGPVRDALLNQFSRAPEGAVNVFTRQRKLPVIRRFVEQAIAHAGLQPWPRLMQQLRASFATDCVRRLPANAASAILGHSAKVAAAHYWSADSTDLDSAAYALRNVAETGDFGPKPTSAKNAQSANTTELSSVLQKPSMGQAGVEPALKGF